MTWAYIRCTCWLQNWVNMLYREEQWGSGQYFSKADVEKNWFVCFGAFSSISRNVSVPSHGDVSNTGEGMQIWTYTRHSRPLSSDRGFIRMPHLLWYLISVYMVISEDPWHPHLLPSVWQWSYHYLFLRLTYRSIAAGARTPNLPLNCGANYPWKTKEKMISR